MPSQTGPVLVVGYTMAMQKALDKFMPDDSCAFVDEPTVARKRDAAQHLIEARATTGVLEWEYQLPGAADRFANAHPDLAPAAVLPGVEYAVPFAARLAERYGVPGATYGGAAVLRDKHLLRLVSAEAGIRNPRSVPVEGPDEVRAALADWGTVVLKPANRQAAVGTRVLSDPAEVEAAWADCTDQDEGIYQPDRGIEVRMLVEEYVRGREFSVELMSTGGRRVFGNVTAKELYPGDRPIEIGHTVPADVSAELTERLLAATDRALASVGFGTGFVHCEWIVDGSGEPCLVECAGRMPGDGIIDLIEYAWDVKIVEAYLDLMRGRPVEGLPASAPRAGAVWFLHPGAGEVVDVTGVEEAEASENVLGVSVVVHKGDTVGDLRSSWDRVAMVEAGGSTTDEALRTAQQALELIRIQVA
ncbi:MAG TPA: ATP-grasp domain-containing protein [Mycobacteriales bacterium]